MATFVLVHGGGHGGWCFRAVAERLRAAGHEVFTPTLTGLGERAHLLSANIDLATHIEDIVLTFVYEDLRDVILLGHSYGGMVITGVADRMTDRVRRLVYLDAPVPHTGESVVSISPGLVAFADVREVNGIALGLWPEAVAGPIYGLTDPKLLAEALPRLTPHPWKSLEQPLVLRDPERVASVPRSIVNCTSTLARRGAGDLARWRDADDVHKVDCGHDLMLIAPDAVAKILCEITALP